MDKQENYRQLIKKYISRHVKIFNALPTSEVEAVAVFDDDGGNYQWLSVGWENGKRVFNTILYVRLRGGKIFRKQSKNNLRKCR